MLQFKIYLGENLPYWTYRGSLPTYDFLANVATRSFVFYLALIGFFLRTNVKYFAVFRSPYLLTIVLMAWNISGLRSDKIIEILLS